MKASEVHKMSDEELGVKRSERSAAVICIDLRARRR